jgi:transcriptional regulator with XRE-family HTH domain
MAKAIRRFRLKLGDTQQQLASRIGISITSVARYETNSPPSDEVLTRLAELARDLQLPRFAAIFDKKVRPENAMNLLEFAAVQSLLRESIETLTPQRLEDAKAALDCLMGGEAAADMIDTLTSRMVMSEESSRSSPENTPSSEAPQTEGAVLKEFHADLAAISGLDPPSDEPGFVQLPKLLHEYANGQQPTIRKAETEDAAISEGPGSDESH